MGLLWFCIFNHVTWQNIYETKVEEHLHFIWADYILDPIIQIQIHFWSCGQSISHKVYQTKSVVHFYNIQLGQVTLLWDMSLNIGIKIEPTTSLKKLLLNSLSHAALIHLTFSLLT